LGRRQVVSHCSASPANRDRAHGYRRPLHQSARQGPGAVDEKSQIQALDRTQPGLPMKKGRCGTMTHDYKRNGTTTLSRLATCSYRHRRMHAPSQRVPSFPRDHRRANTSQSRLASHRRQLCHPQDPGAEALARAAFALSPALHSGSWLNMVERFFAEITRKRIRRGVFKSVDELKQAIMDYLEHNDQPKPYIWTKTAVEIFTKVARAKQALESQH
jgi:hypothetical protein